MYCYDSHPAFPDVKRCDVCGKQQQGPYLSDDFFEEGLVVPNPDVCYGGGCDPNP